MSDWMICPQCGLRHSRRDDGLCPRCRTGPGDTSRASGFGASPSLGAPPRAAAPAPAIPARPGAPEKKKPSAGQQLLGAMGGLLGFGLSRLFGIVILLPLVAAFLAGAGTHRLGKPRAKPFATATGLLAGHGTWILMDILILSARGQVTTTAWAFIDPIVMFGAALWVALGPGIVPVVLAGLFELVAMGLNVNQLASEDYGFARSLGLDEGKFQLIITITLLIRAATVIALITGLVSSRKQAAAAPADVGSVFE